MVGILDKRLKQSINFTNMINSEIEYIEKNIDSNVDISPIEYHLTNNSYRQNMTYKYFKLLGIDYTKHEANQCEIIKNLDYLAISIVDCDGDVNDVKD